MSAKPRPNHQLYLRVLARMTPDERLRKALELSQMTKDLFRHGLRKRFPDLDDEELKRIYLERMAKCHNRNY